MSAPALVVLAAGLSTRYGRLKQVDPLGPAGESIMDYDVFDAARAGFAKVVFVVRPEIEAQLREHVDSVVGGALPTEYVHQTLDRVPSVFSVPPGRTKPWGTGHAVLCASERVRGPFAVCNADDLYGRHAFATLFLHLSERPPRAEAALVGYRLADTLSASGGVARGLCALGPDRLLTHVTEVREIRRVGGRITGADEAGASVELGDDDVVSMNLWGFSDPVVEALRHQFRRFLDRSGTDASAEFPLSTALGEQVRSGAVRVAVLPGGTGWFGVTHFADRDEAEAILRSRIAMGAYPDNLAAALRGHGAHS